MKQKSKILCVVFLCSLYIGPLKGQETISTSGGNASGSGGSVSYTVGQVTYQTSEGTTGTVAQGVQQPYEISVITAIGNTEDILLECFVFPNPTRRAIRLIARTKEFDNLRFQLYDLNGIRIQDKKIDSEETEILMDSLPPSAYFLNILSGNKEIKTFKIIKN